MNIPTRFEINDEVWFLSPELRIASAKIIEINIRIKSREIMKPAKNGIKGLVKTGEYEPVNYAHQYTVSYYSLGRKTLLFSAHELFRSRERVVEHLTKSK